MDTVIAAFSALIVSALDAQHWPWFCVTISLAVMGQIMSRRVFTKERAYRKWGNRPRDYAMHLFWYGGRETMPLHPYLVNMLIILPLMPDPEGKGSTPAQAAIYWFFSATCSLFAWVIIKAIAKEKGIVLELPGDSVRPGAVVEIPTSGTAIISKFPPPLEDDSDRPA